MSANYPPRPTATEEMILAACEKVAENYIKPSIEIGAKVKILVPGRRVITGICRDVIKFENANPI